MVDEPYHVLFSILAEGLKGAKIYEISLVQKFHRIVTFHQIFVQFFHCVTPNVSFQK